MTITQLEYIIAVDNCRHFATAAEQCFVTQPTLSMQIQKLEENLGCKIFDRSKQPVTPTVIGEEIIAQARKIVNEAGRMQQIIKDKLHHTSGNMQLGILPTIGSCLLPFFLPGFLIKHPEIKITVQELTLTTILQELKIGRLDAAIVATPLHDNELVAYPLYYEELLAYVSKDNTAYKKTYLIPGDIDIQQLWTPGEHHCLRQQILQLCDAKNRKTQSPHYQYQAGNLDTLRKMVEQHKGITILPELATVDFDNRQQDRIRHFKSPVPVREISLIACQGHLKKKMLDIVKQELVNCLPEKLKLNKKINVIKPLPAEQ
jgi:LysR family transcriptional regulator, hydrogen peroxide-inducible genes activator